MSTPRSHYNITTSSLGHLVLVLFSIIAGCALGTRAYGLRIPESEPGQSIRAYTFWNRQYLCLAVKVPDPMLTGSSTGPMSTPEHDDAIEFCLETRGASGNAAHRLMVSVAGGMNVLSRDAMGNWRPDPSWISGSRTVKYAVSLDGTLNNPRDRDVGYIVECAIPWEFLGGEPTPEQELGFNIICRVQGETEGFASWAPAVRAQADIGDSARWGRMIISYNPAEMEAWYDRVESPFVARTPFIDGRLGADEWLTASAFRFDRPEPVLQAAPAASGEQRPFNSLLAIYRYDWQGNLAEPGGARFWMGNGTPATANQPMNGTGPWYSYTKVTWHHNQLAEAQRSGIDIILASYRGDKESRQTWARAGLDRLSEALKRMRAEGRSYPLVGMQLDTGSLHGVDLTSQVGKQLIYGMIRDFFLHVPKEFWAQLGARPQEGKKGGVPVLLGEPEGIENWDEGFLDYCQSQFARDFGDTNIIWLGSSGWRKRGVERFFAYVRLPAQTGFMQEGVGGASAVALSPGYCSPPGSGEGIRPRREGAAYRGDWQKVQALDPELIVINSWNDFANGTEIAPSRHYGYQYVDLTRMFKARLGAQQSLRLHLNQAMAPEILAPGREYQVELLVENLGTEDFTTGRHFLADHKIVRDSDKKVVQIRTAVQDLSVLAGQTLRLPIVISVKDNQGEPLPPGKYLFSLVLSRTKMAYLRSKWFARTVGELAVPISVGKVPASRATVISTSLPSSIETGATEQIIVRLRNDGSKTWRIGNTKLSYHWIRCKDNLTMPTDQMKEMIVQEGLRASLPRDVRPGEVVSVMVPITAAQPDGTALPVSRAEDLWHYRIQWDLVEGQDSWFSHEDAPAGEEAIQVVLHKPSALFASVSIPSVMQAGENGKVEIALRNAGSKTWEAKHSFLNYHWYSWDGRAIIGENLKTPLPSDVAPGQDIKFSALIAAPAISGPYWLTLDLAADENSASSSDVFETPVMVQGGKFRTIDLAGPVNAAAITDESHRSRGDFDGKGRSLPAEWLPPDLSGSTDKMFPSGYYAPNGNTFTSPFAPCDRTSGVGGAVACTGQSVSLGEGGAEHIHLLIASTSGRREAAFRVINQAGEVEQLVLEIPSWTERERPVPVGLYTPYICTITGDELIPAYLYHLTLTPNNGKTSMLELPEDPSIKVLAITVED